MPSYYAPGTVVAPGVVLAVAVSFGLSGLGALGWWLGEGWWETESVFAIDAAIGFLLGSAVILVVRHKLYAQAYPFPRGVYLFAREVVDARDTPLVVTPLADLKVLHVTRVGPGLVARREVKGRSVHLLPKSGGPSVMVIGSGEDDTRAVAGDVAELLARARGPLTPDHDVFAEIRDADGSLRLHEVDEPGSPQGRFVPWFARHPMLASLALALAIGATAAALNPPRPNRFGPEPLSRASRPEASASSK